MGFIETSLVGVLGLVCLYFCISVELVVHSKLSYSRPEGKRGNVGTDV